MIRWSRRWRLVFFVLALALLWAACASPDADPVSKDTGSLADVSVDAPGDTWLDVATPDDIASEDDVAPIDDIAPIPDVTPDSDAAADTTSEAPDVADVADVACDGPCAPGNSGPAPNPALLGSSGETLREEIQLDQSGHLTLDYATARGHMFGTIDNIDGEVECIYTGVRHATVGIPDGGYMNTEHGWPQSRGASQLPQRSNLHHLFPTRTPANDARASYYFGEVVTATWSEAGSKRGPDASGEVRFEVRAEGRGNIARALFYFSVVYAQPIPAHEEAVLRAWHAEDPVDARERARNNAIAAVQSSRNPFVDFPQLVNQIDDF
ncbi:MAG: endonuclease [Bradymonadaceae bacterium]|nr:endonuclease [Lujinxingiaceae bacterium]